ADPVEFYLQSLYPREALRPVQAGAKRMPRLDLVRVGPHQRDQLGARHPAPLVREVQQYQGGSLRIEADRPACHFHDRRPQEAQELTHDTTVRHRDFAPPATSGRRHDERAMVVRPPQTPPVTSMNAPVVNDASSESSHT